MVIKGVISIMAKLCSVVALKALKCILSDPTHLPQHSVPFDFPYCQLLLIFFGKPCRILEINI